MKKVILAVTILVLGFGLGVGFDRVRAQSQPTLADAKFMHVALSVKDVDKTIDMYASELGGTHTPIRVTKCEGCKFKQFGYDENATIRTSEIKLADGFEVHLMQSVGHTAWSESFEKHGEGSIDHIAFRTKDVQGVTNALIAKGGKVAMGDPAGQFDYIQMPHLPFLIELFREE